MMKKLLLLLLLLAPAGWTLRAQGPHEIHLSISGPAGGGIYDDSGSLFNWGTDLYSMYEPGERVDSGPVYSLGYTYSLRSWLRVGAEASSASACGAAPTPAHISSKSAGSVSTTHGFAVRENVASMRWR